MALHSLTEVKICTLKAYFYIFLYIDLCNYKSNVAPARGFSKHRPVNREINANTNSSVLISYLEANSDASTV